MCRGFCLYPMSSTAVLRLMAATLTGMKHMRSSWAAYMNHKFCSSSSPAVNTSSMHREIHLSFCCGTVTYGHLSLSQGAAGLQAFASYELNHF